jgi:hypothetical protein
MALEQTQTIPAPVLSKALEAFTNKLPPMMGTPIKTSVYDPQVADRTKLQTDAYSAAGGLGSLVGTGLDASGGIGPATQGSIASYMSPYQQEVMNTTMTEFDRQQTIGQQGLRDQAITAGAYGGGREGIMQAEYMNQGAMNRAALQAQLLQQGFGQAQQARGADLMAQQGLGTYMDQMGQAQQGYDQATKDATTLAAREAEYEPYTRLGLIGQQLAQIQPGAFPTTTIGYQQSAAPASPMASWLGGGAGAGGVLGKLGIFG